MASPTFVQAIGAEVTASLTISQTLGGIAAGDTLIVHVETGDLTAPSLVSTAGNSYTLAHSVIGGSLATYTFICLGAAAGSDTVTATSTSASNSQMLMVEYTAATSYEGFADNGFAGTVASTTLSTTSLTDDSKAVFLFTSTGGGPSFNYTLQFGYTPGAFVAVVIDDDVPTAGTLETLNQSGSVSDPSTTGFFLTPVGASPVVVTGTFPAGTNGAPYTGNVSATGGTAPYTFAVTTGSLPPGLSLDASSGDVTGASFINGTYPFTITATDSLGAAGSAPFTITIAANPSSTLVVAPVGRVSPVAAVEAHCLPEGRKFVVVDFDFTKYPMQVKPATAPYVDYPEMVINDYSQDVVDNSLQWFQVIEFSLDQLTNGPLLSQCVCVLYHFRPSYGSYPFNTPPSNPLNADIVYEGDEISATFMTSIDIGQTVTIPSAYQQQSLGGSHLVMNGCIPFFCSATGRIRILRLCEQPNNPGSLGFGRLQLIFSNFEIPPYNTASMITAD